MCVIVVEFGSWDLYGVYKCLDVDVVSLEEMWKFFFNVKE